MATPTQLLSAPAEAPVPAVVTPEPEAVKERPAPPPMSGIRKATVLLIAIGPEASADIVKELAEDEIQRISKAVSTAAPVTSEEAVTVLGEFQQLATARSYVVKGGVDYAAKMLNNAFGSDYARRLIDRVTQSIGNDLANFDSLQKAEPQQLANFIHSEHPQTIALILSHLNPTQAAALLTALPTNIRSDLSKRMAHLDQISPEIIARIAHVVGDKLKSLGDPSRESYGGVRAVAEMFNRLDAHVRKDIMSEIAAEDEDLVETIRHLMFVFEDLITIDPAGIKEILAAVDRRVLTVALKGTSDRLKQHIMQNLSQAGAEMLREDVEALGPVKIKDVEAAQQEIVGIARTLEAKGALSLTGSPNEQYVA